MGPVGQANRELAEAEPLALVTVTLMLTVVDPKQWPWKVLPPFIPAPPSQLTVAGVSEV